MPRSSARRLGGLPTEVTSFVGRHRELRQSREVLAEARLLTLVGGGGTGKSRLARRLGEELGRLFPDGVVLVDLASWPRGTDVAGVIRAALPDLPPRGSLTDALDGRSVLLVLDNAEHLLDECAAAVVGLLSRTTSPRILVTSREPLGVLGEHLQQVGPLDDAAARQLFVDRAASAALDVADPVVAGICRTVGGLPLAVELCALRLRVLTPADLLRRLADPEQLLHLTRRAAQPRQRSLLAVHQWSWQLCSEPERLLWERLSVFAGPFDLPAATAVCADGVIGRAQVPELLAGLVEKSVVTREAEGGDVRYRLPETCRRYGERLLGDTGEDERLRQRRVAYFAGRAAVLLDDLHEGGPARVAAAFQREHGDLAAAMQQLLGSSDYAAVARLAALQSLCSSDRDTVDAARRALVTVLPHLSDSPERARALWVHDLSAITAGEPVAARSAVQRDDGTFPVYLTELVGLQTAASGDLEAACELLTKAVRGHAARADEFGVQQSYRHLQAVAWLLPTARWTVRASRLPSELGLTLEPGWAPFALFAAGLRLLRERAADEASTQLRAALNLLQPSGDPRWVVLCCEALAACASLREDHRQAARLLGHANGVAASLGMAATFAGGRLDAHGALTARLLSRMGAEWFRVAVAEVASPGEVAADPVAHDGALATLTPREVDVAELVCQGLTNRAIGAQLTVSTRTIETHVEHIMTKLGCTRRTQIAARLAGVIPAVS